MWSMRRCDDLQPLWFSHTAMVFCNFCLTNLSSNLVWRSLPIGIEEAIPPNPTYLHSFLFCSYTGHTGGNPYFLCWCVHVLSTTSNVFGFILIFDLSSSARFYILIYYAFADPKDPSLRKLENSFLLGPVLVYARFFYYTWLPPI